MKTIGLIGGMSWESTVHYYQAINLETRRRLGGLHSARLILHSVDFAPIAALQAANNWPAAAQVMIDAARGLERAGADMIAIASNTMHMAAADVQNAVDIPFLHIARPTAQNLVADGFATVGLLGTRFTLGMDFYTSELEKAGLTPLVPKVGITDLNAIIYEELCRGIVRNASRKIYIQAIERLALEGAEAIILGCTEIAMLIDDSISPLPTYDTTEIHAKALAEAALAE